MTQPIITRWNNLKRGMLVRDFNWRNRVSETTLQGSIYLISESVKTKGPLLHTIASGDEPYFGGVACTPSSTPHYMCVEGQIHVDDEDQDVELVNRNKIRSGDVIQIIEDDNAIGKEYLVYRGYIDGGSTEEEWLVTDLSTFITHGLRDFKGSKYFKLKSRWHFESYESSLERFQTWDAKTYG